MTIPSRIIDFHVHLFPDRMFEAIWKFFSEVYRWDVIYRMYAPECIAFLHERGVETIVYSNYAHRPGVAEELNRWNHEILDRYEQLYCFAAFHPDDKNPIALARRALDHPRVIGFKLQLLVQRFAPDDERFFPLYDLVIERKKRILFHVGTGPVGNEFVGLAGFRELMARYPELPANVAHMGAYEYRGFMELLAYYPNLFLDTSFTFFKEFQGKGGYDLGPEPLERWRDRILYGSDFPNLILPRESELETLASYRLSEEFYRKAFHDNGARLIQAASAS